MIVWVGGLIGVFFTGVYGARLMRLTFYGPKSTYADVHLHDTSHGEAPATMFWTVTALAAGAILSGFLAIGFGAHDLLADWLQFVAPTIDATVGDDVLTTALAWSAGLGGAALVWWVYARAERLAAIKRPLAGGAVVAENLFYWDALYRRIAYLPASLDGDRALPRLRALGHLGLGEPHRLHRARVQPGGDGGPERRRADVRHGVRGGRGGARRLLPGEGVAVTSALIFLPLAGALLVALLPLPRRRDRGARAARDAGRVRARARWPSSGSTRAAASSTSRTATGSRTSA